MIRTAILLAMFLYDPVAAAAWRQVDLSGIGMSDHHVTALEADPLGRLWVGFADGGVAALDGEAWTNLTPEMPFPPAIETISVAADGVAWMANRRHEVWRLDDGQWQTYVGTLGLRSHWVRDVPNEEHLRGIDCYRRDITRIDGDGVVDGVPFTDNDVSDLLALAEGGLWIGMGDPFAVLLLLDGEIQCWNRPHLANRSGSTIARSSDGSIWVKSSGTDIMRYDGGWSLVPTPQESVGVASSPDGTVYLYGLGFWRITDAAFQSIHTG